MAQRLLLQIMRGSEVVGGAYLDVDVVGDEPNRGFVALIGEDTWTEDLNSIIDAMSDQLYDVAAVPVEELPEGLPDLP